MELQEIVQRIITLNIAKEKDIAIVGDKEYSDEIPNLKYIPFKDTPLIKNNAFKAVVIKDPSILKKGNLGDVFRISKKYVLLADPSYLGAIKKTEDFIEHLTEGGFGQIYRKSAEGKNNYVDSISKEIEKLDTRPELTIITKNGGIMDDLSSVARKERGDADIKAGIENGGEFLFNFALIQNLKKQIVEKEKTIVDKTKDIEILKKDVDTFKKNIENLMETIRNLRTAKDIEIKDLENRLKKESGDKKNIEILFFKKLKKKEDEVEELKEAHEKEKNLIESKSEEVMKKLRVELESKHSIEKKSLEAQIYELNKRLKHLREVRDKENKELLIKTGKEIKRKTEEIEKLRGTHNEEIEKLKHELNRVKELYDKENADWIKKLEDLKELYDKEKKETVIHLGRQLKKKEDELVDLYSRYNAELDKKTAEMEDLRKRKGDEIEKLKGELGSIKKDSIYKLLSKIKPKRFKSVIGSGKKYVEDDEK